MKPRTPKTTSFTARTSGPAETNTRPCVRSGRATPSRGLTSSKPYKEPLTLGRVPFLNGPYIPADSYQHTERHTTVTDSSGAASAQQRPFQRDKPLLSDYPAVCGALQFLRRKKNLVPKHFSLLSVSHHICVFYCVILPIFQTKSLYLASGVMSREASQKNSLLFHDVHVRECNESLASFFDVCHLLCGKKKDYLIATTQKGQNSISRKNVCFCYPSYLNTSIYV